MEFVQVAGRRYAMFSHLRGAPGLVHGFSTRGLDVCVRSDEQQEARAAARRQVAIDLGLDPARLVYCRQVHETCIVAVDDGRPPGPLDACDAVVTAAPGVPLMTFSADCPLVLLYDPVRRVLGLVHASWRCTVGGLTWQVVQRMQEEYAVAPETLRAGIGPGAGPCCYQVQQDVCDAAAELPGRARLFSHRGGRLYFDLWQANRGLLEAARVPAEHIETAGLCTMCRPELFYSYRREGAGCGHFGLLAALVERA
jgi:YfiH family protein